jgi:hypothetical protein
LDGGKFRKIRLGYDKQRLAAVSIGNRRHNGTAREQNGASAFAVLTYPVAIKAWENGNLS